MLESILLSAVVGNVAKTAKNVKLGKRLLQGAQLIARKAGSADAKISAAGMKQDIMTTLICSLSDSRRQKGGFKYQRVKSPFGHKRSANDVNSSGRNETETFTNSLELW
jgi:hypothetical protein